MVQQLTVIYITNNELDPTIFNLVRDKLLVAVDGLRLITVSQEPLDFGENIVVGKLPKSSLSINLQMLEGLKRVETPYIAIAEHDVLYTPDHFTFIPPNNEVFFYNDNVYMLQTYSRDNPQYNGMFSLFKGRMANSQLICGTEIMIRSTQDRIKMMSDPEWLQRYPLGRIGESGALTKEHALRLSRGSKVAHVREMLLKYIDDYRGENFQSKRPNVDIRHETNLTKNQRGTDRRYEIPYWGSMEDIFHGA